MLLYVENNFMKTKEEIIKLIEEKLGDIEYENTKTRMTDEYYLKMMRKFKFWKK